MLSGCRHRRPQRLLDKPIAARCERAAAHTAVVIGFVAVITGLVTRLALCEVVSTIEPPQRNSARVGADVRIGLVTVVAGLVARLELAEVLTAHAVAAGGDLAVVAAGALVVAVAIITGFSPSRTKPSPQRARRT